MKTTTQAESSTIPAVARRLGQTQGPPDIETETPIEMTEAYESMPEMVAAIAIETI